MRRASVVIMLSGTVVGAALALGFVGGRLSRDRPSTDASTPSWALRGYRINDRWENVRRSLSCRSDSATQERACYDGVDLELRFFSRAGLLDEMIYEVPLVTRRGKTDAREVWLEVRGQLQRILGLPDSVTDVRYSEYPVGRIGGEKLWVFWSHRDGMRAVAEVMGAPYDLAPYGLARTTLTISRRDAQ